MAGLFHPSFASIFRPERLSPRLLDHLASRIQARQFLPNAAQSRNQYQIVEQTPQSLRFRATSLWTGAYVGLNDVSLQVDWAAGAVHYSVSYWIWARYCLILGAVLGLLLVGSLLVLPSRWFPADRTLFWIFVIFWCVVWPWILIALHKGPARGLLMRLLNEANQE